LRLRKVYNGFASSFLWYGVVAGVKFVYVQCGNTAAVPSWIYVSEALFWYTTAFKPSGSGILVHLLLNLP